MSGGLIFNYFPLVIGHSDIRLASMGYKMSMRINVHVVNPVKRLP